MNKKKVIENFKELTSTIDSQIIEISKFVRDFSYLIKEKSFNKNGTLFVLGNGGLYSEADHFCGELTCTYIKNNRKPYNAINLISNPAGITAWANDFNFITLHKRAVNAQGKEGDILYVMSTSAGHNKINSQNSLYLAIKEAKKRKLKVVSIIGNFSTPITELSDVCLKLKSKKTNTIQEIILFINHLICECLE